MPSALTSTEAAPLRVAQFTRSFHIGGTEVQVVELLRALPSSYESRVCVLEDAGPLMEKVRELGHTPPTFPLRGSLARPNTALQIARLALWLRRERVDLLHVHDFYSTMIAVPAARLAFTKVVVGRLDLSHWQGRARRALHAQLSRMADHVVVNAQAIRNHVLEEGVEPRRISVIPNGLDLARFDARAQAPLAAPLPATGEEPVLVHVANMNHPVKRQEDLMEALYLLRQRGFKLHTFLVGDGPRRPQLEKHAERLGLKERIHFLSYRSDVPAILKRSTLGVLCSSAEGMSNAVMEGMAARLPMVVTRVGGNPDLIADQERGRVVSPQAPDELALALQQFLEHPRKAQAMGQAARRFVERELSVARMVRRHDELYRLVLGHRDSFPRMHAVPVMDDAAPSRRSKLA